MHIFAAHTCILDSENYPLPKVTHKTTLTGNYQASISLDVETCS